MSIKNYNYNFLTTMKFDGSLMKNKKYKIIYFTFEIILISHIKSIFDFCLFFCERYLFLYKESSRHSISNSKETYGDIFNVGSK